MNEAVIAYPIDTSPTRRSTSSLMEENVYSSSLGDSKFADDTIEMSGNFFSQLDSMIAAVKVESSALDSMKEKLKEVENLRNQISNFTKRLLDADQANLNLKANLVKVQEMYAETKKAKAEVESSIVPIRAELNRTKEQCNKERQGRLAAQQQVAALRDQISMLEQANENLDREVKTIPALAESNEILKNDLAQLRRRYKEEKVQMSKHIKALETQSRDVDAIRGCVRDLSMKLLDLANSGVPNNTAGMSSSSMNVANMSNPNSAAYIAQQQQLRMHQHQQQQQHMRYTGGNMQAPSGSNIYYQPAPSGAYSNGNSNVPVKMSSSQHMMRHNDDNSEDNDYEDAEEDEESNEYEDEHHTVDNNNTEYENDSFVDVNSSIESTGSAAAVLVSASKSTSVLGKSSGGKKKKTVRRNAGGGQSKPRTQAVTQQQQQQPRMMQQLHDPNNSNNTAVMYQQPQQYRTNNTQAPSQQQQQGMQQSFSLPRI